MRARLRGLEMGRARQESMLQSARLLALQARVEPQFLFDALDRVREAIDRSVDEAEHRLLDLIALLRAMQPAAGTTASSVEREFSLLHAFGRAAELPALQPGQLTVTAETEARDARLAPLLLLPTMRTLAACAPMAAWRVTASRAGPRLQMVVQPETPDMHAAAALESLDLSALLARMRAVHGPDAYVGLTRNPGPALRLSAPFETQPSQ
jgi:LytS/YehU family sensor histidine kinase